jgi:hypothetical protein
LQLRGFLLVNKKKVVLFALVEQKMIIFAAGMTGGTGTCHTSDFVFATCVKSIFQDITFSVFAYDINKKGVTLSCARRYNARKSSN